jgi:transposase-like protein
MSRPETVDGKHGPKCPYCGREHTEAEDWEYVVTYWGEDGPLRYTCTGCELDFSVEEIVTRRWESTPIVQGGALDPEFYVKDP